MVQVFCKAFKIMMRKTPQNIEPIRVIYVNVTQFNHTLNIIQWEEEQRPIQVTAGMVSLSRRKKYIMAATNRFSGHKERR